MRPIPRPGLHILRRDLRMLQLGVEWPAVAAILDTPAVAAVLRAVDGFRDLSGVQLAAEAHGVSNEAAHQAIDALLDSGALVDQAVVRPPALDPAIWSTMWLLAGPRSTAAEILRSRRQSSVYVEGSGRVCDQIRALLSEEQLTAAKAPDDATVVVLGADGEPSRAAADEALRRGVPYLCVGIRELVGLVGPFVVPGRTSCLRCVDLSRSDLDPCWRIVVDSMEVRPPREPSRTPSLVATVAGYAASEIVLWTSGSLPSSCDHVVEIPHGLGAVQTVGYPPHPQCGCGWQDRRDTMSA